MNKKFISATIANQSILDRRIWTINTQLIINCNQLQSIVNHTIDPSAAKAHRGNNPKGTRHRCVY